MNRTDALIMNLERQLTEMTVEHSRYKVALEVIVKVAALHGEQRILNEANFALNGTEMPSKVCDCGDPGCNKFYDHRK